MGIVELFLIGVSLSMDAFAVAVCKGLGMKRLQVGQALIIGLFFGVFQAIMPLIGWAAGGLFRAQIDFIDHWIAFALLAFIGGKMLYDAFTDDASEADTITTAKLDLQELTLMSIATSIDALAVGITFAFLQIDILPSITIIGITTFVISIAGVVIGHQFGARFEKPATIAGGIILIFIGLKILLEHLGVLP